MAQVVLPVAGRHTADCGHFLQEERGEEVGKLLAEFFSAGE
jgi:hypothetical protein